MPRQNGRHFADDTFKRIFVNENVRILIEISLKFVPKGPINNIPSLVQIMAWRRPFDKPLSEPMMVCLPTHICVTRPQWVKSFGNHPYGWAVTDALKQMISRNLHLNSLVTTFALHHGSRHSSTSYDTHRVVLNRHEGMSTWRHCEAKIFYLRNLDLIMKMYLVKKIGQNKHVISPSRYIRKTIFKVASISESCYN